MKEITVIKLGGHAMTAPDLFRAFAQDMTSMAASGTSFVVVHGGGPQINDLLARLHIQSEFCNGLRVTDDSVLEVVEMALCGKVNKELVRHFLKHNILAVGISGEDAAMLMAGTSDPALGRVGRITRVNTRILDVLLGSGFLPVVAPLALGRNGEALNVNADTAAGAIAGALRAAHFVLVSDVPGVLDKEGELLPDLLADAAADLERKGVVTGGMIPKLEACLYALQCGCGDAIILDGRAPGSLRRFLLNHEPCGTIVRLK